MKAIVSGGGTGGHIYPALAIAKELAQRGAEILYMGCHDSLEKQLAEAAGFPFRGVSARGLRRKSPKVIADLYCNYCGLRQASQIIRDWQPDIAIGCGGYATAAVLRAGQRLGIPTLIHEQNAYPGLANRQLAKRAQAICLTFAAAAAYFPKNHALVEITGLPVRQAILQASREEAYRYFHIEGEERLRPIVLITGGSHGAQKINDAMLQAYDRLLAAGLRIIHLVGKSLYNSFYPQVPKHERLLLLPYLDAMEQALVITDLAVARAGASFLAEATCIGLPTLLVPYPYAANDHQRANALAMVKAGAALMVDNQTLTGDVLVENILPLFADQDRLTKMADAAASLGQPQAAARVVDIAEQLVQDNSGVQAR